MPRVGSRLHSGMRTAAIILFLISSFGSAHAHPIADLLKFTVRVAGRTTAGQALSTEARLTKLATDRAFRTTVFRELEIAGNRALAEKLALAWARADAPLYQQAIIQEVKITQAIRSVGIRLPEDAPIAVREEITSTTSMLVARSLDDVPLSSFASREALEAALVKAMGEKAVTAAQSSGGKYVFEVASGKFTMPFKAEVLGVEIKAGDINIYKVAIATAGLVVCGATDCIDAAAKTFLNGDKKATIGETPAQSNERLRRLGTDAALSDDPLNQFVMAIAKATSEASEK